MTTSQISYVYYYCPCIVDLLLVILFASMPYDSVLLFSVYWGIYHDASSGNRKSIIMYESLNSHPLPAYILTVVFFMNLPIVTLTCDTTNHLLLGLDSTFPLANRSNVLK